MSFHQRKVEIQDLASKFNIQNQNGLLPKDSFLSESCSILNENEVPAADHENFASVKIDIQDLIYKRQVSQEIRAEPNPNKIHKAIKTTVNDNQVTKSPRNSKRASQSNEVYYYQQPSKAKLVQDKEKKNMYTFVSASNDQDEG